MRSSAPRIARFMPRQSFVSRHSFLSLLAIAIAPAAVSAAEFRSHPSMRPLPVASRRERAEGPAYFVDAAQGSDAADGSEQRPWKTILHGVAQLQPGDTLYLRGGAAN